MDTEPNGLEILKTNREQKLKNVYLLSFRYGEGDLEAQMRMIKWFVLTGKLSMEDFGKKPNFLTELTPPKRLHTEDFGSDASFEKYWQDITKFLKVDQLSNLPELEEDIMDLVVRKEIYYQDVGRPGREDDNSKFTPDSSQDKYSSTLRRFVLFNDHAGEGFDELFSNMKVRIQKIVKGRNRNPLSTYSRIKELRDKWESHHKGARFFPRGFIPTPSSQAA